MKTQPIAVGLVAAALTTLVALGMSSSPPPRVKEQARIEYLAPLTGDTACQRNDRARHETIQIKGCKE